MKDFRNDAKGHRDRLAQGHRVRRMLDQLQQQTQKLVRTAQHNLRAIIAQQLPLALNSEG